MAKISEMSLEELQDYCLTQDNLIQALKDEIAQKDTEMAEMTDLNHALQVRNNQLFRRVEQGVVPDDTNDAGQDEPPTPSCEEFASNLKGVIRK